MTENRNVKWSLSFWNDDEKVSRVSKSKLIFYNIKKVKLNVSINLTGIYWMLKAIEFQMQF